MDGARMLALGLLTTVAAGALQPLRPAASPELGIAYVSFVGRIEPGPDAPEAVILATPDGEIVLLPNRFEVLVAELGGHEVEIEGLLLTIGQQPLLWIEAIHWNGSLDLPPRPIVRPQPREIPI